MRPVVGVETGVAGGGEDLIGGTIVLRGGVRSRGEHRFASGLAVCAVSYYPGIGPYSHADGRHCYLAGELTWQPNVGRMRVHVLAGAGFEQLEQRGEETGFRLHGRVPTAVAGIALSGGPARASVEARYHLSGFDHHDETARANPQLQITVGYQFW